jgi:segregation and condensation protein A
MPKETYEVKLPLFEGPFDLLLFFIERDELDIHDIPISRLTHDFLDYVKELEALNIELASEFILVAATLMQIKARMLLPRTIRDEQGNEIDPREDLIRHLLAYKKYKSVVAEMAAMELVRMEKFERGNVVSELEMISERRHNDAELQDVSLYKMLWVYQRVMKRYELDSQEIIHTVVQYPYSMDQQKEYILRKVLHLKRVAFMDILAESASRMALVYNFLSILELLQAGEISLQIGLGYNNFWIEQANSEI